MYNEIYRDECLHTRIKERRVVDSGQLLNSGSVILLLEVNIKKGGKKPLGKVITLETDSHFSFC